MDLPRGTDPYLETVLQHAPIAFALRTEAGLQRFVAARYEEILGCPPGTIVSPETLFDRVWPRHPELRETMRARIRADILSGDLRRLRWENLPVPQPSGETRYVTAVAIPVFDQGLIVFTVQDTTERVRAEERLRQSERRFQEVAESVADFVWEVDAQGTYTYASPAVERILGYTPEELVGRKRFYDLFAPEAREERKAAALAVFERRQPFRAFAKVNVGKHGSLVPMEMRGVPQLDAGGDLRGYRGADTEVTVSSRADERRRASGPPVEENGVAVSHAPGLVGESPALQEVLAQVRQVAPTSCSVLITGETGTGKELVARAIHEVSPRRHRTMVSLNCAALPADLMESELFGHERGAYTGAVSLQIGRFELADGSTLFLDEIGELTLELQAKLLRVLGEGYFERLGSTRRREVDVRLIAATNRDLSEEVRHGRFRKDLYYRLNVFPIHVPSLRERPQDIPLLVHQFAEYFGRQSGRVIDTVPRETMEQLQEHPWPGNVRELRNVIERAVILSRGGVLSVSLSRGPVLGGEDLPPLTLEEVERRHIRQVLLRTQGRIAGRGGAAALLGVNRTTLQSMIKRLGIVRSGSG